MPAPSAAAALSAAIARWRLTAIVLTGVLIVVGVAWETFLAPLRPGGSLLAFKVLPLVFGLAAFRKDRLRHYQLWTMLILAYLCEGVVRGMSDAAPSSTLGCLEALLAAAIYVALTRYVQLRRREAEGEAAPAGGPAGGSAG